jgi:hypothetical protein
LGLQQTPAAPPYRRAAEARRAWELHQAEIARKLYLRADNPSAVVALQCENPDEAGRALASLPLVEAGPSPMGIRDARRARPTSAGRQRVGGGILSSSPGRIPFAAQGFISMTVSTLTPNQAQMPCRLSATEDPLPLGAGPGPRTV